MAERIRVRHVTGGEKDVSADRLGLLSPRWSAVDPQPERPKPKRRERGGDEHDAELVTPIGSAKSKRPAKTADDTTTRPAVVPDNDSQEG